MPIDSIPKPFHPASNPFPNAVPNPIHNSWISPNPHIQFPAVTSTVMPRDPNNTYVIPNPATNIPPNPPPQIVPVQAPQNYVPGKLIDRNSVKASYKCSILNVTVVVIGF